MAMTAELRVNAQTILSKSGDMKSIRGRLSGIMNDMKAKFQALNANWESDASAAYQGQFNKIHKDIEEMLNIVDEYTRDLDEVAQGYITTEKKIEEISGTLPANVFGA